MKKITLVFAFLFAAGTVTAQLYIKPKGTGSNPQPSYMYVKDQVVFVKGNIDLQENTGTQGQDYRASIYLRDGAQLIQGEDNTGNTGNGYLSVQQKSGTTNSFVYYYWNSPVSKLDGGNYRYTMENIYEALGGPSGLSKEMGTRAKPVDQTAAYNSYDDPNLTISTRWYYQMRIPSPEKEAAYQRINDTDKAHAGYGFIMKGINDADINKIDPNATKSEDNTLIKTEQLYEFRGLPNGGDYKIEVQGEVDPQNQRMTLAGNPYPSALDLNEVFHDNAELHGIYFYDEDRSILSHLYRDKVYGFGTWTPSGYNPGGTDPGTYTAAPFRIWDAAGNYNPATGTAADHPGPRFAPIGQGVMFSGNKPNIELVTIKNKHRRYIKQGDYGSTFFRPTRDNTISTSESGDDGTGESGENENSFSRINPNSLLRLYVTFDDGLTRDLALSFNSQATDGFDRGYDGPAPYVLDSDAYFPIERNGRLEPFVINGTNFERSKRVPITFVTDRQTEIKVFAPEEINKRWESAYLYDSERNRYTKLVHPEQNHLAGRFVLPAGIHDNRFFIVFENELIAPRPGDVSQIKGDIGVFQNNPGQQLEIRNPQGYEIKGMNMFDMSGKLVLSEKNLGDKVYHQFATSLLSDGVYMVKLTTTSDIQMDYKVIIMNK